MAIFGEITNRGWWDTLRRHHVDRLLMFLDRFDKEGRVQHVRTAMDEDGYLINITMEMASGERYTRNMDYQMLQRLEVFERITLYFNDPTFSDTSELIDNALVLLETLFKVDAHRFDCGVDGMHLHYRPLSNLNPCEAVRFIRHVYDWHLDRGLNTRDDIPNQDPEPPKNQNPEGYDAFLAEIDALLAEDDDAALPPEDQLPKAMPTG